MPPKTFGEARTYPRPLTNPQWLGKLKEEIIEADLRIVDSHHHLWDHSGDRSFRRYRIAVLSAGVA